MIYHTKIDKGSYIYKTYSHIIVDPLENPEIKENLSKMIRAKFLDNVKTSSLPRITEDHEYYHKAQQLFQGSVLPPYI